ncbi:MAG TPA: hypothetical protein VHI52_14165 [Verrucomicrobiae bacterium]|nr:hypothetical protein [Verrucomicrobiae bacterium]
MAHSLKIAVADQDPDYLGLEISASNGRFSGATFVYAGLDELERFAKIVSGFPRGRADERTYAFGTKDKSIAGGYCSLKFYCQDSSGHAAVDIELEDDEKRRSAGAARFSFFPIVAGDVDRFVSELKSVQKSGSGEATIESHG